MAKVRSKRFSWPLPLADQGTHVTNGDRCVVTRHASVSAELFPPALAIPEHYVPWCDTESHAMTEPNRIAATAALLGDPARANMLAALMDGRALTAKELAYAGHITPQTASEHLGKLTEGGLLAVKKQGRHRYYRLASSLVGQMLEGVMAFAEPEPARATTWRGGEALRTARTCYDHLAGRLGVALADALTARGHVALGTDGGEVTEAGTEFLDAFGAALAPGRRVFCRPCLDWSERRPHLAGRVGAALACRCFELGWIARQRDTRAVAITTAGQEGFRAQFGIVLGG
jgi:DNA-binding transcriptional ArsR family regulator